MNQQLNYQGLYPNPNASNGRDVHSQELYQGNIPCPLLCGDRWKKSARCDFSGLRAQLPRSARRVCAQFEPCGCVLRCIETHMLSGDVGLQESKPLNVVQATHLLSKTVDVRKRRDIEVSISRALYRFRVRWTVSRCNQLWNAVCRFAWQFLTFSRSRKESFPG